MAQSALDHKFLFGGSNHGEGQEEVPFPTNKGSLKFVLLHGNLDIWVKEAKNLPNMFHQTLGDMFPKLPVMVSRIIEGRVSNNPYVSVSVCGAVIGRTFVIENSENLVWMQHLNVPVAHYASEVLFFVKDDDVVGSQPIGVVGIPAQQLYTGIRIEGQFPILGTNGEPCKAGAELTLSIQFTPVDHIAIYQNGVGSDPDYNGVPGTYFPIRKGGKVTLYQDAHVHDGCLPKVMLDGHVEYEHGSCWLDIANAISQARRFIYITGWSVYHNVKLVRDGHDRKHCTLGDLLKIKSQEGLRVLLLVWDDPTSRTILGYTTLGIMNTSHEETRRFFKHSSVQVLLCPRSGEKKQKVGTIYTHHQKTVIVDAGADNYRRKIVAFVGGLDLCAGRYDTPEHHLFRTLETVHEDDYHNPNFLEPVSGCPREPWHDMHSKIDGPAAYDILTNFEERWSKASKSNASFHDSLLRLERIPDIIGIAEASSQAEHDPETWHTQVFRSIDSTSVKGFPHNPKDTASFNLLYGKNVVIDMSIHTAYVKAIRSAQRFIYIENQYFLGSSYNWDAYKDWGANNLIPMEIALKIASKIRERERFSAYILIPMWPEGVPIQRILLWQQKTMQMMYETIYKALVEAGVENTYEPQDYLNFFCLGNREALDRESSLNDQSSNTANTSKTSSKQSRRFMIYVHSKGMIVDDEFVILGSANINQRSMDGTRDTEIAMGAYQPWHTLARKGSYPRGQVHGYRMSLWAEHVGGVDECFERPESVECVRRVRLEGETNWRQFAAEKVTEMKGHLLKYPVEVDRTGKNRALPGHETFPDIGGNILGTFQTY